MSYMYTEFAKLALISNDTFAVFISLSYAYCSMCLIKHLVSRLKPFNKTCFHFIFLLFRMTISARNLKISKYTDQV